MSTLSFFSSVPGMLVPGMGQPGRDQLSGSGLYLYTGQGACFYLDYLDVATGHTLAPVPGNHYTMTPANSRAGLTVPPAGRPWFPGNPGGGGGFAPMIVFRLSAAESAAVRERALNAHGHYFSAACPHCDPAPRGTPPVLPDTAEGALAAHGHYPGGRCAHCDPPSAQPEPVAVRVAGPDFAPGPSMAQVRADLERSRAAHGHYAPGGCKKCMSGGRD